MEVELWPEIKAMFVRELHELAKRFPSFELAYQVNMSCANLAQDLVAMLFDQL